MAVDAPYASDDLPLLPDDATPAKPSIAEQQRAHAAENPDVDSTTGLPFAPAPAQPPSILEQGKRGILLGTRATAEGVSGLPAMALDAVTWPMRAVQRAVGIPTVAPSDLVSQGLDAAQLPKPQTPSEQNVSTIVRGGAATLPFLATGGAPTVANAARLLIQGGAGALGGEKAAALDMVPPYLKPSVSLLASMLAAKGADVATNLGIKGVNAVAGNVSPVYEAFRRAGVPTTLAGTVGGGELGQSLEASAARIPFASSVIRPAQQRTLDGFGNSVDRTATQLDPAGASATAQTTGDALQSSYRNWVDNVFNGPQGRQATAWQPLNQRMAGSSVDQSAYRTALENSANPPNMASMPATQRAFSSPQARTWLDALNRDFPPGTNFSWEQAQAIKQRIGDAMGTPDLVAGIGMQNLKNIYGGLANGMENTAVQHGQGALFNNANAVTTAGHTFMDNVGSKIARANNPAQEPIAPEQATNSILNSGDTTLQAVRTEMPDAADVLAAYKLRQASTAKPSVAGAYDDTSTGTFLTNMNRMRQDRPGGYSALYGDPSVQQQVGDLQTVAGRLRATERHVNTSGTAEQLGWMAYLQGIGKAMSEGTVGERLLNTGYAVGGPPILGVGLGRVITNPAATRYAAARGGGQPIVRPLVGGLLGDAANLYGQ